MVINNFVYRYDGNSVNGNEHFFKQKKMIRARKDKIEIGIIGCTESTEFLIKKLLKIEFIHIKVVITLSDTDGQSKAGLKKSHPQD